MKRFIILGLLSFLNAYIIYDNAGIAGSYTESKNKSDLYEIFIEKSLYAGDIGLQYKNSFGDDGTLFTISMGGGYESYPYKGFLLGFGGILSANLYSNPERIFDEERERFLINSIYASYSQDFTVNFGRFKSYEEWNNNYIQGISAAFNLLDNLSIQSLFSVGNAIVDNEFITDFRNELGPTFLIYGDYELNDSNMGVMSYLYHNSLFTTVGIKGLLSLKYNDLELQGIIHIVNYIKHYSELDPDANERVLSILEYDTSGDIGNIGIMEGIITWQYLELNIGLVGVSKEGARLIDYYGSPLPLNSTVGVFYPNAFTLYSTLALDLGFEIKSSIRNSFLPAGNVFAFETSIEGHLRHNVSAGITMDMLYNRSDAISFYGGREYTNIGGFINYVY